MVTVFYSVKEWLKDFSYGYLIPTYLCGVNCMILRGSLPCIDHLTRFGHPVCELLFQTLLFTAVDQTVCDGNRHSDISGSGKRGYDLLYVISVTGPIYILTINEWLSKPFLKVHFAAFSCKYVIQVYYLFRIYSYILGRYV